MRRVRKLSGAVRDTRWRKGGTPQGSSHRGRVHCDVVGKATQFKIFSLDAPHMRTFHVTWLTFAVVFLAAVTPESLSPIIRNLLDLRSKETLSATLASLGGNILARSCLGVICDIYGPRYGHAGVLLCVAPALLIMATVKTAAGFIATRFFTGIALGIYVTTTYSACTMFSPFMSGKATSIAAGWGNVGGGVAELVIPQLYRGLQEKYGASIAWRVTVLLPGLLMLISGALALKYMQDYPSGQYWEVVKPRRKNFVLHESQKLVWLAISNYRTWVLMLLYAVCFGVEITMYAILPSYFVTEFGMDTKTASLVTAGFGTMDLFARPLGGISSDWCGRQYGMRGRCWLIFLLVMVQGVMCIMLGLLQRGFAASIVSCIAFSIMVQAAEGAVISVVSFVSFRAMGTVQGLVGAAGPLGAVVYMVTFFNVSFLSTSAGFIWMGIWTCATAMAALLIHFPMWGSMLRWSTVLAVEEDYYGREWAREEILAGDAVAAMHFAAETISERGRRSLIALMHDSVDAKQGNAFAVDNPVLTDGNGEAEERVGMREPLGGRYDEIVMERLALLDNARVESANWEEFITKHAPASSTHTSD